MSEVEKKSYKDTLNLPQTAFPMEAKLTANEPARLAKWKGMGLYGKTLEGREKRTKWVLHDGPPFANGDIHIGHVINKTLKDVFVRFHCMKGELAPYVPGWDCHGLPIEQKIQDDLKGKFREMDVAAIRALCFEHARKFVGLQSEQFQRLGILGDWENPYLTMAPAYEAGTLEVFAKFVEAGLVYKKLKPVPWSVSNQTALADAELEQIEVEDPSVFVEFGVEDAAGFGRRFGVEAGGGVALVIWTTTPWTLPANLAVAVHPEMVYAVVKYSRGGVERVGVVAEDLVKRVFEGRRGVDSWSVVGSVKGADLKGVGYRHPFADRVGTVVEALYVTATDGTGLVHTAPGHGEDDYLTGLNNKLPVYSPVMANGKYDETVPAFLRGMSVWEANGVIIEKLREIGVLFDEVKIVHKYPHDWRSKKRVITRATEQWFVALDQGFAVGGAGGEGAGLRERALEAARGKVKFVPEFGKARLVGMLESRPDWCISRQRAWGLPIPVFSPDAAHPDDA